MNASHWYVYKYIGGLIKATTHKTTLVTPPCSQQRGKRPCKLHAGDLPWSLRPRAFDHNIQGESLTRGPKLFSMYTVEQRGFLVRKYWQTGSFKACQTAFRTEFGERRAPSKYSIQKLVKKLETRGSRSNACRLLSLGPTEGQSVQKYTAHNRTTQRRYTPRDSIRQRRHFEKSTPKFGETDSSVLGYERRPVSASIMSRSCFASFRVCVYKFSSHYLNNIIFYR